MLRKFAVCSIALSLIFPATAYSKEKGPLRLAPASPWNVHFADDSCRFARAFGEGKQQIIFTAMRFDDSDQLRISFYGQSLRTSGDGTVRLQFHPSDTWIMAEYFSATGTNNLPALVLARSHRLHDLRAYEELRKEAHNKGEYNYRTPSVTPAQEEAITHIELSGRSLPHVILETRSLGKVMTSIRECTDQLLTEWGLDAARHKNLSVRVQPITNPGGWLNNYDYPMDLQRSGVRGIVNFRLMVDEEGRATSCHIQQSTRPPEFDKVVCKAIMQRARFNPARDSEGAPLPSYYNNSVRFSLPG